MKLSSILPQRFEFKPPPLSVSSQYPFGSNVQPSEQKKGKFQWPEWSEADINAEVGCREGAKRTKWGRALYL